MKSTTLDFNWVKDVWRSVCSPKLRFFLWSTIDDALPIGKNLRKRRMVSATQCPRYNELETKIHIFFTCPFAADVWKLIPTTKEIQVDADMEFTEALIKFRGTICLPPTGIVGAILPWILWSLWTSRNKLIFENRRTTPVETATKGLCLALEWNQAQGKESKREIVPEISRDRHPRASISLTHDRTIACKTDAAWDKNRKSAGLAWNFSGPELESTIGESITQDFVALPLIAEVLAVMAALGAAKDRGFTFLNVFSDSLTLIGAINGKNQRKELIGIITDIRSISTDFTNLSFSFFSRSKNSLSDSLAKTALRGSVSTPVMG
ncbi:uncharacterized protein LOC130494966 [Raphanus sativus]|uniref:Uncharacterized protein LOC130494966 n=1 Tax=Raphanus sativus TaxID=3726 RepID=A0A9W3BR67_RAPSA|nr:uncharacterized protein LOC130494966 [Raphanus sativus]